MRRLLGGASTMTPMDSRTLGALMVYLSEEPRRAKDLALAAGLSWQMATKVLLAGVDMGVVRVMHQRGKSPGAPPVAMYFRA